MYNLRTLPLLLFVILTTTMTAQTLYNNGNHIWFNNSAIMSINGDLINAYGNISLTNNNNNTSKLIINGNAINNSEIAANGIIQLSGNWYNNSDFSSDSGEMILSGNSQLLSGTETTDFYSLSASASGIKTLTIDQNVNGILDIYNAEFSTDEYQLVVLNTSLNAIEYNEGFVSSDEGGALVRLISTEGKYAFPVGSHIGDDRVRPIFISQYSDENSEYQVRFVNNSASLDDMPITNHDTVSKLINDLFYHEIKRAIGSEPVLLEIEFNDEDGDFNGITNWYDTGSIWETLEYSNGNNSEHICYADSINIEILDYFALCKKKVSIEPPPENLDFIVYNSFSPNGDNYNETWIIDAIEDYPNCTVSIFNRNGNLIFFSDGYENPWTGEYNGQDVPDATYYYIIDLNGDGSDHRKGNVTIIR